MKVKDPEREARMVRLCAAGHGPRQIAAALGLTPNAVIGALWRYRRRQRRSMQSAMQKLWEDLRDGKVLVPRVPRAYPGKRGPISAGFRMYTR